MPMSTRKRKINFSSAFDETALIDDDDTSYSDASEASSSSTPSSSTTSSKKRRVVVKKKREGAGKAANYRSRLCSVPGCTKQVQQGGVCCRVSACENPRLCHFHYIAVIKSYPYFLTIYSMVPRPSVPCAALVIVPTLPRGVACVVDVSVCISCVSFFHVWDE